MRRARPAKMTLGQTVTIASPQPSRFVRGQSAGKGADPIRTVRISDQMYATIEEACDILGMSKNEFIRWCSYMVANDTIRQYRAHIKANPPPLPTARPSPITTFTKPRITRL